MSDQQPPNQGRDERYDWLYEPQSRSRRAAQRRRSEAGQAYPPPAEGTRVLPDGEQQAGAQHDSPYHQPKQAKQARGAGGSGGPARPARTRGRKRFPIVRTILLLVLAYVVFLVAVPVLSWNRVERVDATPAGDRPADGNGTNYLLVGSDSREGLTPEQQDELGTGDAGGQRTDSIMVLHVPSTFGTPVLISIPRDSYVPIPGHGSNKVNAAFSFGGPELLVNTVEQATDLRIDEYVEIGFGGFVDVVESVNGVEMCLPEAIQDDKAHIDLPAGCQMLNGVDALGYVRMRYSDPRGDLGRVERQQQFLNAVTKRALQPQTLFNPIRYWNFGMSSGDALTAGEDTGVFDMGRFLLAMRAISSGAGVALTVPTESESYSTPVGSAIKWDSEQALALFRALDEGNPVPANLIPDESGEE